MCNNYDIIFWSANSHRPWMERINGKRFRPLLWRTASNHSEAVIEQEELLPTVVNLSLTGANGCQPKRRIASPPRKGVLPGRSG